MSRWLLRSLALSSVALAACSGSPFGGSSSGGTASYKATLSQDLTELPANLRDVAVVTVRVESTRPPLPEDLEVRFTTAAGSLRLAADGMLERSVTARVNRLTGLAEVQFICATTSTSGNVQPANDATARITAELQAGGSVSSAVRATGNVTVRCNKVEDASTITMLQPVGGEGNHPDRLPVVLQIQDFDGSAPARDVIISKVAPGDPSTGRFTTSPSGTDFQSLPLTLTPQDGNVQFYILYPGDGAVVAGPAGYTFKASFTNTLNVLKEESFAVRYSRAPNNATIGFVDMTVAAGNTVVRPRGTTDPFVADVAAGTGSMDAVNIVARITDRSGSPAPEGTLVTFTCTAQNDVRNCAGFTGLSVFAPDAGVQNGLPAAMVPSTIQPASAGNEERGIATATFRPSASSSPDTLTITAEFKPVNAGTIQIPVSGAAFINLVDNNTISVVATVERDLIEATQNTRLTVSMRRGTSVLQDRELCISLDANSFVRGFINDQDDDPRSDYAMVSTGTTGTAEVIITPQNTLVRGPISITMDAIDVAYDRTRDTGSQPCRTNDASTQTLTRTVQVNRAPILSSMVFLEAAPAVIGVAGSSIPTTTRVTFLVIDDENNPLPDQQVDFRLDVNGDPSAAVSPTDLTDSNGITEAFVSAGSQAASLVVVAEARRGEARVYSSSDPIAVVGGKPAWNHTSIGVVRTGVVYAASMVEGLNDPFGASARPAPSTINVQLSDRFSNRLVRTGGSYNVQFRAESGNINQSASADPEGFLSVSYFPGPTFAMDTFPLPGEYSEASYVRISHLDAPQPVFRHANPRDGDITILMATRGEEGFQDVNGNGAYDQGEPFVDLPEPFLDKNNDGLRATCDLPLDRLPVHRDVFLRAAGVGTYCNPFFDGDVVPNDPSIASAAECRAHWCPDWDPQWSCVDADAYDVTSCTPNPCASGYTCDSSGAQSRCVRPRTPERVVDGMGNVVGGRVLWCPLWRVKDYAFRELRAGGTPVAAPRFRDAAITAGFRPQDGYVLVPGIAGLVLDDATTVSSGIASGGPQPAWATLEYSGGAFRYRAPGDAFGAPVTFAVNFTDLKLQRAITVASANGQSAHIMVDQDALEDFLSAAPMGVGNNFQVDFTVGYGDPRSPYNDFDRSQLRVIQTDQFIDNDNDGRWDDVNGRYDVDTLIWKQIVLLGVNQPWFFGSSNSRAFTINAALPQPVTFNRPPATRVAGGLSASFHAAQDADNIIDWNDATGASDKVVVAEVPGQDEDRASINVVLRMTDSNGNAGCPYENVRIRFRASPFGAETTSTSETVLLFDQCLESYNVDFPVFRPFCGVRTGAIYVGIEMSNPLAGPGGEIDAPRVVLSVPYEVRSARTTCDFDTDAGTADGGTPDGG